MRVLIVLPFFHVGGVERWALNVRKALLNQGHEVRFIILGNITARRDDFGKNYQESFDSFEIGYYKLLKYIIFKRQADIIITGLSKLNFILSIVGRLIKIPVITSVHLNLAKKNHEKYIKYYARCIVHKLIMMNSKKIICVSNGIKEELQLIGERDRHKLITIYNPCYAINDIHVRSMKSINYNGVIRIIAAGRLHNQKGFDLLLDAIKLIDEKSRNLLEIWIFGEGEERKNLELKAEKLVLNNVSFKGITGQLMEELREADIFILSSRYEGFGNVLAEALAAGCRCIAFDVEHGPKEILDNGKFGSLVPKNDVVEMSAAISAEIIKIKKGIADIDNKLLDSERINQTSKFTTEEFMKSIDKAIQ
jgi:glycosyltransferase involved in cell wall biosynthesis